MTGWNEKMREIEVVSMNQRERWNQIVKGFDRWDVYYIWEYAYSLFLHGDGEPQLVYYSDDEAGICYVMMKNDIADSGLFGSLLEGGRLYDWTTPYGYGGPLTRGDITDAWKDNFLGALTEYAQKQKIVSQFFRFHPLLQNQKVLEGISDVLPLKQTVYLDTTSEEVIFQNMTPNNRNMVRKAKNHGIEIFCDCGERITEFEEIYRATMQKNHAEEYYYFAEDYFRCLIEEMSQNTIFFYAEYEGKIISASIFLYNDVYMHYHLSGTLPEYNKLGATNLLLTEAANWAARHGIRQMHLGGGVENADGLLRFKKHLNRNGLIDFCIGRNIFLPAEFDWLVDLRSRNDVKFDRERKFLILYRG